MKDQKLRLEKVDKNRWMFVYPEFVYDLNDKFYDAIDLMDGGNTKKAKRLLLSVIDEFPQYIDVIHHLALLKKKHGKTTEESFDLEKKAVDIGKSCFPKEFTIGKDLLEWGFLENRPYLRACHGLGLELMDRNRFEEALSIFSEIISMNPNDNQGIRGLVVDCNFQLKRPKDVIKICDEYPSDCMVEILYGRLLALFQIGEMGKAKEEMKNAIKYRPLIAKELVKKSHKKSKSLMDGFVISGGEDEAYDYWEHFSRFWEETKGAIDFVNTCLHELGM